MFTQKLRKIVNTWWFCMGMFFITLCIGFIMGRSDYYPSDGFTLVSRAFIIVPMIFFLFAWFDSTAGKAFENERQKKEDFLNSVKYSEIILIREESGNKYKYSMTGEDAQKWAEVVLHRFRRDDFYSEDYKKPQWKIEKI